VTSVFHFEPDNQDTIVSPEQPTLISPLLLVSGRLFTERVDAVLAFSLGEQSSTISRVIG
jgi:hypothetical protein